MAKHAFKLIRPDDAALKAMMATCDHRTLGIWALACAEHVMPYFAQVFPDDPRPQQALITLKDWIDTGRFSMTVIRKASLDSHAAAREVGEDSAARSAARSAGHAVGTAHVAMHAKGAANYALQAIYRTSSGQNSESAVASERAWQIQQLRDLGAIIPE